jgi:hypothetical protein
MALPTDRFGCFTQNQQQRFGFKHGCHGINIAGKPDIAALNPVQGTKPSAHWANAEYQPGWCGPRRIISISPTNPRSTMAGVHLPVQTEVTRNPGPT